VIDLRSRLLLALALVAPSVARATNPETTPMSAEAALTGGALLAGDDPGGGGWYNPASLAGIRRSSLQLGASAYSVARTEISGALVTVLPWGNLVADAHDTHFVSVPSVLSLSYKVRDGLGVAVGVWTPYHNAYMATITGRSSGAYPPPSGAGLTASYEQNYGLSYQWDDTWAGAAIGWQALPWLRVGGSLQGAYSSSSQVLNLDTGIETSSTDPLEQGAHLNVNLRDDQSYLASRALVGLQADVTDELRLALVLRSPVVRIVGWGSTTRVTSVAALLPGYGAQQGQLLEATRPSTGLSVVDVGRVWAGGAWTRGRWSVRVDVDWGPALYRNRRHERASWGARAGTLYSFSPNLQIGAGLFRDGARTLASEGALSLDYYGIAGGIDFRPAKVLAALGGGETWDLTTGIAVRGAWGVGKGPGMTIVPFDFGSSVVPIFPGKQEQAFQEVPAHGLEGSIHFFTALGF
jgi:long-subunit fatty acid transport protein